MEDIVLKFDLDDSSSVYVSPISRQTYVEHVDEDSLGGASGYFVIRSWRGGAARLEVLAKAASLEAAEALFDLIVASNQRAALR